jgi:hypothetical protein
MHQASCGSMMPAIIIYYLFVYYIDSLFSVCSGSIRQATCGSMMPAIIIHYI